MFKTHSILYLQKVSIDQRLLMNLGLYILGLVTQGWVDQNIDRMQQGIQFNAIFIVTGYIMWLIPNSSERLLVTEILSCIHMYQKCKWWWVQWYFEHKIWYICSVLEFFIFAIQEFTFEAVTQHVYKKMQTVSLLVSKVQFMQSLSIWLGVWPTLSTEQKR